MIKSVVTVRSAKQTDVMSLFLVAASQLGQLNNLCSGLDITSGHELLLPQHLNELFKQRNTTTHVL